MSNTTEQFYVMEYLPDDAGSPYFMDKEWDPELPDYDIFTAPPKPTDFSPLYRLKSNATQLDGDFLISDNLVSFNFLKLCEEFLVHSVHIPVNISLLRKKKPEKDYYLFFLLDYVEILDREKSDYTISQDVESGLLNTPESRGLDKTYYDAIDLFIVKKEIKNNLFFCRELSKPVCSNSFKEKFEMFGLKGIDFKSIDENFRYDAWAGW